MPAFIRLDGHTIVASAVAAWKEIPGLSYMGYASPDRIQVTLVGGKEIAADYPAGKFAEAMRLACTPTELDFINFLEWLDSTREVTAWGHPDETHEQTAQKYLAQKGTK